MKLLKIAPVATARYRSARTYTARPFSAAKQRSGFFAQLACPSDLCFQSHHKKELDDAIAFERYSRDQ